MAIPVNTYNKHTWVDNSSPDLEAEILNEIETGIKDNNDAIKAIAAAVVSQIVNDPDKIASMAALYAVNQTLGTLSTTVTNINSNLTNKIKRGSATVTFTDSVGTLTHNCGFPDTDYALVFMPTTTSRFPMMATPIDGNTCQVAVRDWTNASGNITVVNFNGSATIKWIAIK